MKKIINRIPLLVISLFFTIVGFILIDKTNLIQILLCILGIIISLFLLIDIIQEIRIIKHPSIKRNHMFIRTIIAICLISLSVAFIIKVIDNTIFLISNKSTDATITNVNYYRDEVRYSIDDYPKRTDKYTCTTQITYTINNEQYSNYLDTNQCLFKENNKVTIYYNKDNPTEIRSIPVILLPIILSIISIIGTIVFFITARKLKINVDE